jgi:hypothetical protein
MTERLQNVSLAVLVALAIAGAVLVVRQSEAARLRADFTIEYSAGLLIRTGHPADIYEQRSLGAKMLDVAPGSGIDPRLPFSQPLGGALPFVALSLLPIELAFRLWQILTLALMLAALLLLQRHFPIGTAAPWVGLLALLACLPAWATFTEGQPTVLLMLGAVMLVAAAVSRQWWMAAAGAALLAIKPQYLPAYLLILVAVREWRLLAAAGAGAAAMLLSPLAAGGPDGMAAMVRNALGSDQVVPLRMSESWIGSLAGMLPASLLSPLGIILAAITLLGLLAIAWRRWLTLPAFAALAGWVAVLASPHSLPHDLLLLAVPAWMAVVLYRTPHPYLSPQGGREMHPLGGSVMSPVVGLVLTGLSLLVDQQGLPFTVCPLVMTAVLGWYALDFRRRMKPAALSQTLAA